MWRLCASGLCRHSGPWQGRLFPCGRSGSAPKNPAGRRAATGPWVRPHFSAAAPGFLGTDTGVPKCNTPCRPDVPFVVENTCHRDHCPVHNLQTANPGLRVDGRCDALLQPGDGIWRSEMETPPLPLRLHPAAAGELSTGAPRALGTAGGHRATADTGSHALTR